MIFIIHILAVLVLGKLLHLDTTGWVLAFVFGVLVDLDHMIKLPLFLKMRVRHVHWRSPLQEPVSYLWIVPVSIFLNSYVPVLFFTSHLLLDYFLSYERRPFFPFLNLTLKNTGRLHRDTVIQAVVGVALCIFLIQLL